MADSVLLQQAGSGTLLLVLIQVASRGFTFIGNQFLLRFLSPSLLGIAVQLELVSVTSLYFARESLRVALQRRQPSSGVKGSTAREEKDPRNAQGRETQTVVNLSYLAVFLGLCVSTIFGYSYLHSATDEVLQSPYFNASFQIYAAATLLELLAEPAFVIIQQKALYKDRARAETGAAMARCISACLVTVLGHRRGFAPSILPFALGQAAYAATLLALYLLPTLRLSRIESFKLVPVRVSSPATGTVYHLDLFHKTILSLASTMYLQSIFKLFLTQGDALIMSFLSSLADQGAFALASNYGGLLARLILQPVEESSRNTFGRLLAPAAPADSSTTDRASTSSTDNDAAGDAKKAMTNNVRAATQYLTTVLHAYLTFARFLILFAPPLIPTLVTYLLAPQWRTAATSRLLCTYCYYIPLMAVNGILDAFVTSLATPAQLRGQSLWMLLFTALYGLAAWVMMSVWDLGSVGLVGANMLNMGMRIVWSSVFVHRWAKQAGLETGEKGVWTLIVSSTIGNTTNVVSIVLGPLSLRVLHHTAITGREPGETDLRLAGIWMGFLVVQILLT